jgi:hypothetical protein
MTVESASDRAAFLADFGVTVTWTRSAGGSASTLTAIFERPSDLVDGQAEVELLDRHSTLLCREADLPSGAAEDDPVSVVDELGSTHSLRCRLIRPDGTGFAVVDLKL